MSYRILGLDPAPFRPHYGLGDAELQRLGIRRVRVESENSMPERIELRDGSPGETLLLLNHMHQSAFGPYRSCHAIYVREGAERAAEYVNEIPAVLARRTLSLRAFDAAGDIVDAALAEGSGQAPAIRRLLAEPRAQYLHAHYAAFGCYAARIERM